MYTFSPVVELMNTVAYRIQFSTFQISDMLLLIIYTYLLISNPNFSLATSGILFEGVKIAYFKAE